MDASFDQHWKPSWKPSPPREELAPEEIALASAQRRLAEAIEATRRAGQTYFAKPLKDAVPAREEYYDALMHQASAERQFYDAKNALMRSGGRR